MADEMQESEEQPFDLSRWSDLVRRRHMQFLVPMFVGWLLVWGSSWFLQPRYKSSTQILVEEPTMPKNYVTPNVNDDLQGRLESISQQILSSSRLLYIIDELHLYSGPKDRGLTPDDKVERMRRDIGQIELVRDREGAIASFRVNYVAADPRVAQQVTRRLTDLFIHENLRVRQQQSQDTTRFLESQLEQARASLAEQDARIRAFQSAHEGELPEQQTANVQILSGLQQQYQSEQQALNTARQQKIYFQSMLDQYRALERSPVAPDGSAGGLAGIDQQLQALRTQLAQLRSQYTDSYPDVVQLKEQIARTEKARSHLLAQLKASPPKAEGSAAASPDPTQNPQLIQLAGQLHSSEVEIQSREQALAALGARIATYQGRLSAEPASQQQMADLTRGYEQSKANFDDLLKKENESRMATSMEQLQQGERFTVLDPPSLPLRPDFPNRLKMCAMGLAAGTLLGLLVVALLEFLDDRLYSDRDIKKLVPGVVLTEVPEMQTAEDQRHLARRRTIGWATAAAVALVVLAGTAFSYLQS